MKFYVEYDFGKTSGEVHLTTKLNSQRYTQVFNQKTLRLIIINAPSLKAAENAFIEDKEIQKHGFVLTRTPNERKENS